jgi:hypothetical protein
MMRGPWIESQTTDEHGFRSWNLEVVDCNAFLLVMNVIHGRTRQVDRHVDLEMLAKISVIVDDLGCHEPIEVFSDMWIEELQPCIPIEYTRELILWMCIATVFNRSDILKHCSRIAILKSAGQVPTLGLPIRQSTIGKKQIPSSCSV